MLDRGCATGTTGAALKARQPAHVTGIEIEPEYAREAGRVRDRVVEGDVAAPPDLGGPFDRRHPRAPDRPVEYVAGLRRAAGTGRHGRRPPAERRPLEHLRLPRPRHLAASRRGSSTPHLRWFTLGDATALLTRGSRLDRFAPPLQLFTFQYVIASIKPA